MSAPTSDCKRCAAFSSGGTERHDDPAVEVVTGVDLVHKGEVLREDMIRITVKCARDPHVLQFVNREIIDADGTRQSRTMKMSGHAYETTTDPKKPVWSTDSSPPSPYYEVRGTHCQCPGKLYIWDDPYVGPEKEGETWKANFSAFIICDGKVIRRVDWTRFQTRGRPPGYSVEVTPASSLPSWATDLMAKQGYTYP